ncbi:cyclophilin-like domain-containing protein [Blastocladiella britannica]|nr:cyclophilin-like domain-containing protein [Blastocladiella britannica]
MDTSSGVFLEFSAGDAVVHAGAQREYGVTVAFLRGRGSTYGLGTTADPSMLNQEQREMVASVWSGEREYASQSSEPRFDPPAPLVLGRIEVALADAKLAPKACANFVALCTGSRGMSKSVKTAALHYRDVPMHRIERGFVAQGGDVTRRDGSGGDSIHGGKFNDERGGLTRGWRRGTVAMANAGKNSNTSQFFVCLAADASRYAKLEGKHVVLGHVREDDAASLAVLDALDARGSATGVPSEPVWVSDCGVLQ